jgi:glycerol transport system substrate-binding protein
MTFSESGPVPAQGQIAQQMFWYTAFTADMVGEGAAAVLNEDGSPRWRMAPSPHGAYWQEGTKVGYQDVGSWTLMESTPMDRAQAAWLYAQFVTSMTVDVEKAHAGLTFIRESTIQHESFTERAPELGGLVEFYRSPDRVRWSPTGTNIPDYPRLAQLWWQNIGDAVTGAKTAQEALDALCQQQRRSSPVLSAPACRAIWAPSSTRSRTRRSGSTSRLAGGRARRRAGDARDDPL